MPRSASSQELINKLLTAISGEIGLLSVLKAALVGHEDESIPNTKKFKEYLENKLKGLNDQKGCSGLEDLRLKIEVTYVAIALHGTIDGENLLNKIGRVLADEINSDVSNFQRDNLRGHLNKFFPPGCLQLSQTLFSIDVIQCNHPDNDRVILNLLSLLKREVQSYESSLKKTTKATEEYKINLQKHEIRNTLTSSTLTTALDKRSLYHIFHYAGLNIKEPKPDKEINEPQQQYDKVLKEYEQDEQKKIQGVQDNHAIFWQEHLSRSKDESEDLQKDQIEIEMQELNINNEQEPSKSYSPTEK